MLTPVVWLLFPEITAQVNGKGVYNIRSSSPAPLTWPAGETERGSTGKGRVKCGGACFLDMVLCLTTGDQVRSARCDGAYRI